MFSKKATKIDGEDFVNFCGLLRKHDIHFHESEFSRRIFQTYHHVLDELLIKNNF